MGDPSSDSASVLSFSCPRCGHEQRDDFEVLDLAVLSDWRCEACERVFSVLLTECSFCGAETVTVALAEAEQVVLRDVICQGCGKAGRSDEAGEHPDFVG